MPSAWNPGSVSSAPPPVQSQHCLWGTGDCHLWAKCWWETYGGCCDGHRISWRSQSLWWSHCHHDDSEQLQPEGQPQWREILSHLKKRAEMELWMRGANGAAVVKAALEERMLRKVDQPILASLKQTILFSQLWASTDLVLNTGCTLISCVDLGKVLNSFQTHL